MMTELGKPWGRTGCGSLIESLVRRRGVLFLKIPVVCFVGQCRVLFTSGCISVIPMGPQPFVFAKRLNLFSCSDVIPWCSLIDLSSTELWRQMALGGSM